MTTTTVRPCSPAPAGQWSTVEWTSTAPGREPRIRYGYGYSADDLTWVVATAPGHTMVLSRGAHIQVMTLKLRPAVFTPDALAAMVAWLDDCNIVADTTSGERIVNRVMATYEGGVAGFLSDYAYSL